MIDCLSEELNWIKENIKGVLKYPYFFTGDTLVIASEDVPKVEGRLKERIWTDRNGQKRLWYYKIIVYHSQEEYAWLRILK